MQYSRRLSVCTYRSLEIVAEMSTPESCKTVADVKPLMAVTVKVILVVSATFQSSDNALAPAGVGVASYRAGLL